ncbi:chemotaxis protein [Campylobacter canadensis]|uniref:Chemotaxis protein n=1 Tax=Campylobacter canadensis TaxID=449520 RepID=A0ABS7WUZ0_9BACT|nr:chemotaxis protein [Campylobacter canadensis]MBZ7988147.1 chemotaxis protein [Campylobacter canadensis]MBZ7995597.1 chemotaxis protein [Campylobacter canadensis]MBZ7997394.1 chemotaxis protein [Campylobacter canadensis]MBZ7999132.1 chemotaxis protein [Campylobacter canadensis]MBZ8000934.1 chemotaxis protein [Campylobacter canadensis]
MTQEELDALMAGGLDDEELVQEEQEVKEEKAQTSEEELDESYKSYRPDSTKSWPPPPPTQDHKVVHQLDDVTRDSEIKATELLGKIEMIMDYFANAEAIVKKLKKHHSNLEELFKLLNEKFPNVNRFNEELEQLNNLKADYDELNDALAMGQDEAMMAMDAMQYQDIHRQKIERVINVMRALSKYMNSLFEGKIDDEKRVSSAVHIEGDNTADLVSNDDIEALIASLGKK